MCCVTAMTIRFIFLKIYIKINVKKLHENEKCAKKNIYYKVKRIEKSQNERSKGKKKLIS